MSRVPLVKPEEASPEIQAFFRELEANFHKVPNLFGTLANYPTALTPMLGLFDAVYNRSSLSPRVVELAIIKISYGLQSHYCLTLHKAFALERGVTNDELRALRSDPTHSTFEDSERVVLDFAAQYGEDALAIDDELFARLREHYDEAAIVNLCLLMGLSYLYGQMANSLRIPLDEFITRPPTA